MKRFLIAMPASGGVELHPMKGWLREHPEMLPPDLEVAGHTSHQLRRQLKRTGWTIKEDDAEVRLFPPSDGQVERSGAENGGHVPPARARRLDTRLESEGAEFLVLGHLLLERIPAYKTYTNMPGYDLVATNPERNTSAKIQVKSRWRTNAPGFPIRNLDCDFVVFCRLNRGNKAGTGAVRLPEYYVFPVALVKDAPRSANWGKLMIRDIPDSEQYRDRWDLIRTFLDLPSLRPGS